MAKGDTRWYSRIEDGAIVATHDVQNNRSANDSMAANDSTTAAEERLATVDEDSRLADYRPSWWVLPLIGMTMLLAMLVTYLGLRFEQDAIALAGVALFGLMTFVLIVVGIRHTWQLTREISIWWRSA